MNAMNNFSASGILLPKNSALEQLQGRVSIETLLTLPNHFVYLKDLNGKFLQCNKFLATGLLRLESETDVIGLSDFDLPIRYEDATKYRENDKKVAMAKRAIVFKETANILSNNTHVTYKSIKMPLYSKSKKIAGTIGVSNIVYSEDLNIPKLSKRQKQCLLYAAIGYTMKEISVELGLSAKTVEHYFNHIKAKFKCKTRSMLIQKTLQLTFIKEGILNLTNRI